MSNLNDNERLNIKLELQSFDNQELHLYLGDKINISAKESGRLTSVWLTAFEARTIASVLVQMADKLEAPEQSLKQVADEIYEETPDKRKEKPLNEGIARIVETVDGYKLIVTTSGTSVYVTAEVWAKEEKYLSMKFHNGQLCYMNVKQVNDVWWLVDCLPF